MAHPEEQYHPSPANSEYDSAFPNVGLVVWQSGFVLGEYLLHTQPLGSWSKPLRVLELGCGTGQLGIVLALAGADVTLTDLEHITPLTQVNVDLNAARCTVQPKVAPYMWGTDAATTQCSAAAAAIPVAAAQQSPGQLNEGQQQQQQPWDVIVAADVLYEPQHYDELLASLSQLCHHPPAAVRTSHGMQNNLSSESPGQLIHNPQQQKGAVPAHNDSWTAPPVYICYR